MNHEKAIKAFDEAKEVMRKHGFVFVNGPGGAHCEREPRLNFGSMNDVDFAVTLFGFASKHEVDEINKKFDEAVAA